MKNIAINLPKCKTNNTFACFTKYATNRVYVAGN